MSDNKNSGYCNPPEKTKFQKGKSGNPTGRPKGSKKSFSSLFEKELNEKLTLSDGTTITKQEAVVKHILNDAVKGDKKSQISTIKLMKENEYKTISEKFLNRLVKEKYISEEDAKHYANYQRSLDLTSPNEVINKMHTRYLIQNAEASEAVIWSEIIYILYEKIHMYIYNNLVLKNIFDGFNFYNGIEIAFIAMGLPEDQQQKIIAEVEKMIRIKKPSIDIYKKASSLKYYFYKRIVNEINIIKKEIKKIPYFKENFDNMFSQKTINRMLDKAKEEGPEKYKEEKLCYDNHNNRHQNLVNNEIEDYVNNYLKVFVDDNVEINSDLVNELFDWKVL